jgi:hypothetical protein
METIAFNYQWSNFLAEKICSQASLTVVVPAPEDPVMATTGCFFDMEISLLLML